MYSAQQAGIPLLPAFPIAQHVRGSHTCPPKCLLLGRRALWQIGWCMQAWSREAGWTLPASTCKLQHHFGEHNLYVNVMILTTGQLSISDDCASYHDGTEGLQSHYDDSHRFERPIYSLRLFSDSRLSFGTQLYGWVNFAPSPCAATQLGFKPDSIRHQAAHRFSNGAFTVDMPRGCITVLEAGGYAVEGVKHCVRPMDLAGHWQLLTPSSCSASNPHM